MAPKTLHARLARGWKPKRALTYPKRRYVKFDDLPYGGFR